MSPEAQRIAIAEACGWRRVYLHDSQFKCGSHGCGYDTHIKWIHDDAPYSPTLHPGQLDNLPDYLNDLNAMHEAEKTILTCAPWWLYQKELRRVTLWDGVDGSDVVTRLIRATAAQRAEAFLRTIGKWTENNP